MGPLKRAGMVASSQGVNRKRSFPLWVTADCGLTEIKALPLKKDWMVKRAREQV